MTLDKALSTLQERADYLAARIAAEPAIANGYKKRELAALLWVLACVPKQTGDK